MPRQKKIEPLPLETFTYEGIDFEIRDESCWALARHKHLNTTMRYIDINENKMLKCD